MEPSSAWLARLALLLLCAPVLHGGFLAISEPAAVQLLLHSAGAERAGPVLLTVLNAAAAMLVVLFGGQARRLGSVWLAVTTLLGALVTYPFWSRSGLGASVGLQQFLGLAGYAAAFLLVAEFFNAPDETAV